MFPDPFAPLRNVIYWVIAIVITTAISLGSIALTIWVIVTVLRKMGVAI